MSVDSEACVDCGTDTTPCTGKRGCRHKGKWESYMVWDEVWAEAGMAPHGGKLCVGCLETRLGRELTCEDFPPLPSINWVEPFGSQGSGWDTPRLAARRVAGRPDKYSLLTCDEDWHDKVWHHRDPSVEAVWRPNSRRDWFSHGFGIEVLP